MSACCAAIDYPRTTPDRAVRCAGRVDEAVSHTHCRMHAVMFDEFVRRYKQVQSELERVTDGATSWTALEAWLQAPVRARLPKLARLLLRLTRKRVTTEISAFYGEPRRIVTVEMIGAGAVPRFLEDVKSWPDPAAQPDPGHVVAIRKYFALYEAAVDRLRSVPGSGSVEQVATGAKDEDIDDDDASDTDSDDPWGMGQIPSVGSGARASRRRATVPANSGGPIPALRRWTELERGLYEVYWMWANTVAKVHPAANMRTKYDTSLPALLRKLFGVFSLCKDAPYGVLVAIESLGVKHARLFLGDLAWRQMLNSASLAEIFCRNFLKHKRPKLVSPDCPILAAMVASSAALSGSVHRMLVLDSRATKRSDVSGAVASHRCAVALLSYLRVLPIAQRGSLGVVFTFSSHAGALVLAAACVGLCGADDATGTGWWDRFHEQPEPRLADLIQALQIALEVALRKERARLDGRPMPETAMQAVRNWMGVADTSPKPLPDTPVVFSMVIGGPEKLFASHDNVDFGPAPAARTTAKGPGPTVN